jgi:digeranylgeranylglycerophospholipid reductase
MKHVDCLVVGMGPAGASAARIAAANGLQVMGVDKKAEAGIPLQCAEYIPAPLASWCTSRASHIQQVKHLRTHLLNQQDKDTYMPGWLIDRVVFDRHLVQLADTASVEIAFSTSLIELDVIKRVAVLRNKQAHQLIHFTTLVAADGANSRVAQLIGDEHLDWVNSYQIKVELDKPMNQTEIWLDHDYPGGYAWLFPKGEQANLGVAGYPECSTQLKKSLHRLYLRLKQRGSIGKELGARTGGAIPVSGLRKCLLRHECVLYCGDAAGLCHPITGAGIASAVLSGEAAGSAIVECIQQKEHFALKEYDEAMYEQYGASLSHAAQQRQTLLEAWRSQPSLSVEQLKAAWVAYDEYYGKAHV